MSDTLSPESQPSFISISASEYARLVNAERKLKYAIERLEAMTSDPINAYGVKVLSSDAVAHIVEYIKQ